MFFSITGDSLNVPEMEKIVEKNPSYLRRISRLNVRLSG